MIRYFFCQPRKFIFDLFDSLILLGVGGQTIYHGPTEGAEPYFGRLDYTLPKGESVADWLIDISSGRLEPDNTVASNRAESMKMFKKANRKNTRNILMPLNEAKKDDDDSIDKSVTETSVESEQVQKLRSDPTSGGFEVKSRRALTADDSIGRLKSACRVITDDNCVGMKGVTTGKVVQ